MAGIALVSADFVGGNLEFYDSAGNRIAYFDGVNRKLVVDSAAALDIGSTSISGAEMALLDTASAGSITASKVVSRDAGSRIPFATAVPAAAGNSAGTATAITADVNFVTAADGTTGVILPVGVAGMRIEVVNTVTTATALLKVYPNTGGQINAGGADIAFSVAPGKSATFVCTAALTWRVEPIAANPVVGVAAGYKIARSAGAVAVTGTLDVNTGLTTVLGWGVTAESDLDGDTFAGVSAADGPGAGHITIKCWKVTTGGASGNPTLIAANAAKNVRWVAVGT